MDERLKAVFSRRSVRRFTGADIEPRDLDAMLAAGMAAPSARNLQPWRFVTITERDRLDRLAELHPYAAMLTAAGACIAVCADRETNPDFWVQDCSAATENVLIAAAMLGLGAVWLGVHPRQEREAPLKEFLALPDRFGLLCLIAVGQPAEKPEPRTQFDPEKVRSERWD